MITATEYRVLDTLTSTGQSTAKIAKKLQLDSFAVAMALHYLRNNGKAKKVEGRREGEIVWIR